MSKPALTTAKNRSKCLAHRDGRQCGRVAKRLVQLSLSKMFYDNVSDAEKVVNTNWMSRIDVTIATGFTDRDGKSYKILSYGNVHHGQAAIFADGSNYCKPIALIFNFGSPFTATSFILEHRGECLDTVLGHRAAPYITDGMEREYAVHGLRQFNAGDLCLWADRNIARISEAIVDAPEHVYAFVLRKTRG